MKLTAKNRHDMAERESAMSPAFSFIPVDVFVDRHTIKTSGGDYLRSFRLDGIPFESADDDDIDIWRDQLNQSLVNMASPNVSLWLHTIRSRSMDYPEGDFASGFTADLDTKYREHVAKSEMLVNTLHLTIVYRPMFARRPGFLTRLSQDVEAYESAVTDALDTLGEISERLLGNLERYAPRMLSTYEHNGVLCSETLELFGYLVNGTWRRLALPRGPLAESLPWVRPFFGGNAFELRGPAHVQYGAMVSLNNYPEETQAGLTNSLLTVPFPITITQSFAFLPKPKAIELMKRQIGRMVGADDFAISQREAILQGLDDLTAERLAMGEHHCTVAVFAEELGQLSSNISTVDACFAKFAAKIVREDLDVAAAYWAQLPGNSKWRPRPSMISTNDLASLASMHNYPTGRRDGNQWGPAVALLKTASNAPYFFNFHLPVSRAVAAGKSDEKALAHTMIIGPSGSGKTSVEGFLLAQADKFQPALWVFDKDRGLEILVRAMGGKYQTLETGKPTGFGPFQLELTPANLAFLEDFIKRGLLGIEPGFVLSPQEDRQITEAIKGVYALDREHRRLERLLDFLDPTNPDGAYIRLQRWCGDGSLAWAFDNAQDELDVHASRIFGFDITQFLDNPTVRTPMMMYLLHRMESVVDGRRFICVLAEFWKALQDAAFEAFAEDKLKVFRKQNGFLVFDTQSPKDVTQSAIAHTIIEQCATMIFLPNPRAQEADYCGGFKLSKREFEIIRSEILPGSRRFLVKQGHNSVIAELNLAGFNDELAVISGTTENVELLPSLLSAYGTDPAAWLPKFHEVRR